MCANTATVFQESKSLGRSDNRPARVLLVDDEEALLRALRRALERDGHQVQTTTNAQEGLALACAGNVDVVFTDINMPDMDGMEFLRAVRARDPELPVVLMTGGPTLESATSAVALGALRYLAKPASLDDIRITLSQAMQARAKTQRAAVGLRLLDDASRAAQDREQRNAWLSRVLAELRMALQPIVFSADRRLFGFEALLRTGGVDRAGPAEVIEAAEGLGRLFDLGRTIRARVAERVSKLPPEARVFVNLHAADLEDEQLFDPNAPLSAHANRIVLEITERVAIAPGPRLDQRLGRLRGMGYTLAIDDLGSGFGSLSLVAAVQPEVVKIDMSLVREVHKDRTRAALLAGITSACRARGMRVVAEGIETQDELNVVEAAGCDLLQGYLLGRPSTELFT